MAIACTRRAAKGSASWPCCSNLLVVIKTIEEDLWYGMVWCDVARRGVSSLVCRWRGVAWRGVAWRVGPSRAVPCRRVRGSGWMVEVGPSLGRCQLP